MGMHDIGTQETFPVCSRSSSTAMVPGECPGSEMRWTPSRFSYILVDQCWLFHSVKNSQSLAHKNTQDLVNVWAKFHSFSWTKISQLPSWKIRMPPA